MHIISVYYGTPGCQDRRWYTWKMTSPQSFARDFSDRDLLVEIRRAVDCERRATAHLIAMLMEVDARKLYAGQGCSSLFTYCVQALHLSEHAAYLRIEAARLARRFPIILERLEKGSIHLTAVSLLGPHLIAANLTELLDAATHKSKREVEHLVRTSYQSALWRPLLQRRLLRSRRRSNRSRPNATECNSRCPTRPTTSCGASKI